MDRTLTTVGTYNATNRHSGGGWVLQAVAFRADAAVTGGFVYHGSPFPSGIRGDYFFADYAQNWIKRMTFDVNGNVTGVFPFEPPTDILDGPTGDVVVIVPPSGGFWG
jgi:hypothetical protein